MFKQLFGHPRPSSDQDSTTPPSTVSGAAGGFDRFKQALKSTSQSLMSQITRMGPDTGDGAKPLTEADYEALEETLIKADFGVDLALELTDQLRKQPRMTTADLTTFFKNALSNVLLKQPVSAFQLRYDDDHLNVYLIVGVNGAGKTTLIGKLSHRLVQAGKKVVVAAGDTFRAAAEEQLAIWVQRAGATLVQTDTNDAAAVVYDSIKEAMAQQANVLIIDTAGRLQNQVNLMEELNKIKRIIDKEAPPDIVYEALLVLDATTGQNALRQAELFMKSVDLTGIALTKLDGSAKGGIVFNIAKQFGLPVKLVGVGEQLDDLKDFSPEAFLSGLFEA